ncbi:MAG: NUDIX domain-containing protein [Chloroflexi bacterium]|nr:NUDIX domain-containing protein [Chloroflexota bacterium]
MSMIQCTSLYGDRKLIPKEKLILRPAVYGVVVHQGNVLLVNTRHTGKYYLPGGGVDLGERIEDALKREVREETGIEVEVEEFAHFREDFFYYDPLDEAYHSLLFFYICKPKTFDLCDDDQVDDEEAEKPRWVNIQGLCDEDFQDHGEIILGLLRPWRD